MILIPVKPLFTHFFQAEEVPQQALGANPPPPTLLRSAPPKLEVEGVLSLVEGVTPSPF